MATGRICNGDWIRRNQERYLADDSPLAVVDAAQHVLAARAALEVGEVEVAGFMYRGAQKIWRRLEVMEPGRWKSEIRETTSEMRRAHISQYHH